MAKKKKNQNQPSAPETEPITPTTDLSQEEQGGAPPEAANPVGEVEVPANLDGEVAEPNRPDGFDAGVVAVPAQVNDVDTTPSEAGDALAGFFLDMIDASAEGPSYPAHEWQGPSEPPLVLPDETASNEALIQGARQLVQIVGWRMRRSVQEWWLIGCHLTILKSRPENDGRWRSEILPEIGINHTTDHQLRTMAERITLERCLDFKSKNEALRSIGFFASPQLKQLGGPQADADGGGEPKVQVGIEEIFGLGGGTTYEFGGLGESCLTQAAPFDETEAQVGEETEPPVGLVADDEAQPGAEAEGMGHPKDASGAEKNSAKAASEPKVEPQAKKVAAKAAPQPKTDDPIAGTEALVITLSGAEVADMEAAAAESGLTLLAKTQDQIVGLLWYADDPHKVATERVGKALAKLRPVKKKFKVEARYLGVFDSITV